MIRYDITEEEIRARIREEAGENWLSDAAERTKKFRRLGRYEEKSSSWSNAKPAYMALQNYKCAYCERGFAHERFGKIEFDLEHYRPKGNVASWPTKKISEERGIRYNFNTGKAGPGYHLLAYHVLNYCAACKTCNSSLKADYFPYAGTQVPGGDDPAQMQSEEPFLIYPMTRLDKNPESIITFDGIVPMAKFKSGKKHQRAIVTIDFFELATREELLYERAIMIMALWSVLELRRTSSNPEERTKADNTVKALISARAIHASCTRSFSALYSKSRNKAHKHHLHCLDYVARP